MRSLGTFGIIGIFLAFLTHCSSAPSSNFEKELDHIANLARDLDEAVKDLEEKLNVETIDTEEKATESEIENLGDETNDETIRGKPPKKPKCGSYCKFGGRDIDVDVDDSSIKKDNDRTGGKASEVNRDSEKALDTVDKEAILEELLRLLEEQETH